MYDKDRLGQLYRKFNQGYEWYTKEGKLTIRTCDYHASDLEVSIGDLEVLLRILKSQVKDPKE